MKKLFWLLFGIKWLKFNNKIVFFKTEYQRYSYSHTDIIFTFRYKKNKYIPKIKFIGYTECLTTNPIAEYYYWFNNR